MRTLFVAVVVGVLACGGSGRELPPGGVAVDSAGVRIWSIPGVERAAAIDVERVRGFELPDSGWTVWADGVAVDTVAAVVYMLDEATPRVLAFGLDGGFLRQVGRKGKGPAEYYEPTALTVEADGNLAVFDPGTGTIRRWSRDGAYLSSAPMEPTFWGPGLTASADGFVYTTGSGADEGTMVEALVSVSPGAVDTLSTVTSHWRPLEMPCGRVPVPEVLSLSSVWDARGSRVVSASVPRYALTVREDGKPQTLYRRDVPPRTISRAEAEASVRSGPLAFLVEGCGMTSAALVQEAGWVENTSPIFLLTLDDAGRVWAARGMFPAVEAIDVFDPDEGYVGTVHSSAFPVLFVDRDRYLTVVHAEWGSTVELWRVIKKGEAAATG